MSKDSMTLKDYKEMKSSWKAGRKSDLEFSEKWLKAFRPKTVFKNATLEIRKGKNVLARIYRL
jgi:hypothetical protein